MEESTTGLDLKGRMCRQDSILWLEPQEFMFFSKCGDSLSMDIEMTACYLKP